MPVDVIVPIAKFPPGMPLTLQFTAVLVVFVTVAVKVVGLPSKTETLAGLTVTAMAAGGGTGGGGGGDGDGDALPPPQPSIVRLWPKRRSVRTVAVLARPAKIGERDRMPWQKQAKGQRRGERAGAGKLWNLSQVA